MAATKLVGRTSIPVKRQNDGKIINAGSGYRVDGWENLFTGMGIANRDRKISSEFKQGYLLTEPELDALYCDEGIATRIIDLLPDEMLRKGWTIDGDPEGLVNGVFDELNVVKEISRLLKWNRLHGGAVCVLGLDDGSANLEQPLNTDTLRNLIFLRTYSRWRVNWTPIDLYQDPNSPKFGKVEMYNIYPLDGSPFFKVHESRCIVMDGRDVPEIIRRANQGWGVSELQRCLPYVRALGNVLNGCESVVEDFVTSILSIENLQDMIYGGQEEIVKKRIEILDLSRHIINTLLLDSRETYQKQSSTVTGLPELIDRFWEALSVVTGYPQRVLKGAQKGGLNNKGEGETEDWYNLVGSKQILELKPILELLTKLVFLSKKGPFRGVEPENWNITFNPLKEQSEQDEATVEKIRAETDQIYIANGVYDPAEVAISRFGGERYGKRIQLAFDRTPPTEIMGTEGEGEEL
jgi:hypothetical protein